MNTDHESDSLDKFVQDALSKIDRDEWDRHYWNMYQRDDESEALDTDIQRSFFDRFDFRDGNCEVCAISRETKGI